MKKFSQLLHEPLQWKHDGMLSRSMTLRHRDSVIAQWKQDHGALKSDVSIYVPDSTEPLFVFRPKGVFNRKIEVESSDPAFEPAKLQPHKWGGGLDAHFANGNRYIWRKTSMWGRQWRLTTADGIKIAKIELGKWSNNGTITIVSDAPAPTELALLIFAGWSAMILELQAASAGAVAAGGA